MISFSLYAVNIHSVLQKSKILSFLMLYDFLYSFMQVGMRWRIEKEVLDGKGQFSCGEKRCKEVEDLRTWEMNFGYIEQGIKKNALVKLSEYLLYIRTIFDAV